MAKLIKLNEITNEAELDNILNTKLSVFEDVQGSKIFVNYDGQSFHIKPKSLSSDELNTIDLATQNYYNHAIHYLNSLSDHVKSFINKTWWFCFEYFPDNQPANIEYSHIPLNHLVLTCIYKTTYTYDNDELSEYARLLDVDTLPLIFSGYLNDNAKTAIKYFLNTSEKDLEYIFGESNFAFFFYKFLNPAIHHSFLMDDFQNNLEKLIIRVDNTDISFELLNPLYKRISTSNSTEFVDIYSLILINFVSFCQTVSFKDLKIKGSKKDEMYISLICTLFNMYVEQVMDDLIKFDFVVPTFFDSEKFRINTRLIPNKKTLIYINKNSKIEYMFKVLLASLNKPKKKEVGMFAPSTLELYNNYVKKIDSYLDSLLNKKSEIELARSGLLDFGQFFDIKYDVDGAGDVYLKSLSTELLGKTGEKKKDKYEKSVK